MYPPCGVKKILLEQYNGDILRYISWLPQAMGLTGQSQYKEVCRSPKPHRFMALPSIICFTLTTVLTMIVFVITQVAIVSVCVFFTGFSDKRKAYYYPHNNTIEKIWTVIPAIVLTMLVVFGFFTWQKVMDTTPEKGDINIDITGHQFQWELRYPGSTDGKLGNDKLYILYTPLNILGIDYKDRNSFDDLKADTLVLPVNKSIRLNVYFWDVIHRCLSAAFLRFG